MSPKPALGKGLKALIPESREQAERKPAETETRYPGSWLRQIPVSEIHPNPRQPRRTFQESELEELASSIREHGILQPLLVRAIDDGYELVSGERRLRAAKIAGLSAVPVIMVDPEDSVGSLTIALVENVQRADLSVMELARAYKQLQEEFGRTQEEIARTVGKSRPSVTNTLRLLELDEEMQAAIDEGAITAGHARAILMAPPEARKFLFLRMMKGNVSVRQAENAAKNAAKIKDNAGKQAECGKTQIDPAVELMVREMERVLESELKRKCVINYAAGGTGKILFEFYSDRDLEALIRHLRGNQG